MNQSAWPKQSYGFIANTVTIEPKGPTSRWTGWEAWQWRLQNGTLRSNPLMRPIGLLLSLLLIGFLIQRLYGGSSQLGPTGRPAITEPIHPTEATVEQVNKLEQERVKKTMGE